MSISEIARQMHMSRNNVKKHLRLDKTLEYKRKRKKSKLDPVRPIIKELIDKYDLSASLSSFIPGHSDVMDSWLSL